MSADELDRLIEMDPAMVWSPAEDAAWHSAPAGSQGHGAEPVAAPSPQAARLLPVLVDEPTVLTPEARKRDQLAAMGETPPQTQLVKRRICGKKADAVGIYARTEP